MYRFLTVLATVFVVSAPAGAQQYQRRATMVGGGGDRGKCTIEVVVDGAAEVEIRGDQGSIRNLSGNPAEWRRFQCNAPLPRDPANFRFEGIDGRGRQNLVRDPRNGGAAVVLIEDSQGGSEGYTFDLIWGGVNIPGGPNSGPGPGNDNRLPDRDRGGIAQRFTAEQAIHACQDSVRRQAGERFGGRGIEFLNTRIDDNPGRNDWVVGTFDALRGPNGQERFRFSCSVNFDSGQVRSVQIDPMDDRDRRGPDRQSRRVTTGQAVRVCEESVTQQALNRFRGRRLEFLNTRIDDNPGRSDWVIGMVDVIRDRDKSEGRYRFSCSVNFDSGQVRSVQIDPSRYRN